MMRCLKRWCGSYTPLLEHVCASRVVARAVGAVLRVPCTMCASRAAASTTGPPDCPSARHVVGKAAGYPCTHALRAVGAVLRAAGRERVAVLAAWAGCDRAAVWAQDAYRETVGAMHGLARQMLQEVSIELHSSDEHMATLQTSQQLNEWGSTLCQVASSAIFSRWSLPVLAGAALVPTSLQHGTCAQSELLR